jgi:hypothetical protein
MRPTASLLPRDKGMMCIKALDPLLTVLTAPNCLVGAALTQPEVCKAPNLTSSRSVAAGFALCYDVVSQLGVVSANDIAAAFFNANPRELRRSLPQSFLYTDKVSEHLIATLPRSTRCTGYCWLRGEYERLLSSAPGDEVLQPCDFCLEI